MPAKEIVFIDKSLSDYQTLLDGLPEDIEMVTVESDQDGIQVIAEWAQIHSGYSTMHIIGHGSEGSQQLGNSTLSSETLEAYQTELSQIGKALIEEGDILLYGCNVAASDIGVDFIHKLAQATSVDIAASDDLTGAADQGGDWVMEQNAGIVDSKSLIINGFNSVLVGTAPELGGTPNDVTVTEDVTKEIDLSAYDISDNSATNLTLTLAVDRGTIAGEAGTGVTINNSGTGLMTLAGAIGDLNTYLDDISKITYTTATNDTTAATLTVTPNNGTENGTADEITITVTAANDAPVIANLNLDATSGRKDTAINLDTGDNVAITDVDSSNFDSGNLTITTSSGSADGNLSLDGTNVKAGTEIGAADATIGANEKIFVGSTEIGTVGGTNTGQSGATLIVTFNANATPALISTLMQNLSYTTSTDGTRAFVVAVTDGDGATSATSTVNLTVEPKYAPAFVSGSGSGSDITQVSVFAYPNLNGTDSSPSNNNENANLASIVQKIINDGGEYTLDTSITDFAASDFSSKLNASGFFFMTDMESQSPANTSFLPDEAKTTLRDWVSSGGVMMMTGTGGSDDTTFLNTIFGWDLTTQSGSPLALNTTNASETPFADGPAMLNAPDATDAIGKGSVDSFTAIYGDDSNASVATMTYGSGTVIFLGYDYYNSGYAETGFINNTQYTADVSNGSSNTNTWVTEMIPRAMEYSANLSSSFTLTQSGSTLTVDDTMLVSDQNIADEVNVTVTSVAVQQKDRGGSDVTANASTPDNTALLDMLSTSPDPVIDSSGTNGTLAWNFNSGSTTFDYLGAGEKLVLTYTLTADDGDSETANATTKLKFFIDRPNNAPTAADTTESVPYNGSYTFQESDFGFSDVDTGGTLDHITIKTLPTKGTLKLNGIEITAVDTVVAAANIGSLTFTPDNGDSGKGYTTFTFTVNDDTDDSTSAYTVTMNVAARPSTPTTPTTPATSEQIDGADVITTEEQDESGNTVQKITVAPVSRDRTDSNSTTPEADVPLHFANNNANQVVTTVSLPTGVGVTARSNTTASTQNQRDNLIALIDDSAAGEDDLNDMENAGGNFLENLGNTSNLWVNQVTLTSDSATPSSTPIRITGSNSSNNQEALVIDTRALPAGTIIDLDDIEFAVIVGNNVTIRGGGGANIVYAGANSQNIVLGEDDDILHGGAGDDIIGSKGGNDELYGDSGNDTVVGGVGNDTLSGGTGDDLIQGSQQDNGQLVFSLNSDGIITTLYTPDELDLSDSIADAVEFSGDWFSQASFVYEGQVIARDMSSSPDSLLQANADYAFLASDSTRLKTLAILQKVFKGELYTVEALNEAATSDTPLLTYAAQAVIDWREQANLSETNDTESQVLSLLDTFWRYISITRDDINEGVSFIDNGGTWEALLLDVVADANSNHLLFGGTGIMQLAQATNVANSGLQEDIGDDALFGGAGNDTLIGGHGSDRLDGGDGDDIAIQSHSSDDYQFILTSVGELALVYQDSAYIETDTLIDIEQVEFSNSTLDFSASNLDSSELIQLGSLGKLMANNAPSLEQLNAYQADALSLTGLAQALMASQAYQTQWQPLDDASFVVALANQVIDTPFTQADIDYWVGRLDSDLDRADVFVLASGVTSYQEEALESGLMLM